jgi:hypothetical protein
VSGQIHLGGNQEVRGEYAERDDRMHEAGGRQTHEQKCSAGYIDDMIDVEAVPRPLLVADARDGSVEAVAEPVDEQCRNHAESSQRRPADRRKAGSGGRHRRQPRCRQVVRVDCPRQSPRDPDERALFGRCKDAFVFTPMLC